MTTRTSGLLLAVITGVCWAVLAIGLKYSLQFCTPGTIVWFRMLFAFVCLLVYFSIADRPKLTVLTKPSKLSIATALLLAANYFGYMKGVELTTASNAQVMIQMAPLMLVVIGIFYFREIPTSLQRLGIFCASVGFLFFYWDQFLHATQNIQAFINGDLWILFAAVTWALFATFQKILFKKYTPQQLNVLIYGVSAVATLPLANFDDFTALTTTQWIILLSLGLNTLIAYGTFAEAMKRIPASHVSLVVSSNPLLTLALMQIMMEYEFNLIHPEPIHWRGFVGALFIISGVCLTVAQKPKKTIR